MKDKIALVTGASRGLGYATALELGAAGAHVIALARTVGGLEELDDRIKSHGGSATLVPLDLADDGGLNSLGDAIAGRWGRLDVWVHTAVHAVPLSPAGHVSEKDMDKAWTINARALQRLIHVLEPLLRVRQDAVAVIADDPRAHEKFFGAYLASKSAARAIAGTWALECSKIGPRVELFAPNPMPTALRARFFPGEDRDLLSPPADEAKRLMNLLAARHPQDA